MEKRQINTSRLARFVMIVLLLSPILQTYGFGKYNFAFVLTSILAVVTIVKYGFNKKLLPKTLLYFFVYWFFVHLVSARSLTDLLPLGVIKTIIVYAMFFELIEINYLIRYYRRIVVVCIAFFFFQEFTFFTTGYRVLGIITSLPLALDGDTAAYLDFASVSARSSSFFSEPAHFAQYLTPLLAIELFRIGKGKVLMLLAITITLLMLQSGNALIGMACVYAVFIIYLIFRKGSLFNKIVYTTIVVSLLGVGGSYYFSTESGQRVLSRQDQLSGKDDASNGDSGFVRVFRGYFVFDEYSFFEKIIGIDNPTIIKERIKSSKVAYSFAEDEMYFNNFQMFLIHTGIIGGLFFFLIYFEIWKKTNACGRAILIPFLFLSFMSAIFFTETMALFWIIPYRIKNMNVFSTGKKNLI